MLNDTNDDRKIPLYMKIYQIILSRIEQGKYPENSSLPSEIAASSYRMVPSPTAETRILVLPYSL